MLYALLGLVGWALTILQYIVIAAVIAHWLNVSPTNPIVRFLRQVTEPVLAPVRRLLPPWKTGGFDLSPLIVLVAIQFVERVVLPSLVRTLY